MRTIIDFFQQKWKDLDFLYKSLAVLILIDFLLTFVGLHFFGLSDISPIANFDFSIFVVYNSLYFSLILYLHYTIYKTFSKDSFIVLFFNAFFFFMFTTRIYAILFNTYVLCLILL